MLIKIGFVFCHSVFQWTVDLFWKHSSIPRHLSKRSGLSCNSIEPEKTSSNCSNMPTCAVWYFRAQRFLLLVPFKFLETLRIPEVKTMDLQHHLSSNLPTKSQRGRLGLNWWEPNGFWGENHKPLMADSEILNAWKRSTPPITARIRKAIFQPFLCKPFSFVQLSNKVFFKRYFRMIFAGISPHKKKRPPPFRCAARCFPRYIPPPLEPWSTTSCSKSRTKLGSRNKAWKHHKSGRFYA